MLLARSLDHPHHNSSPALSASTIALSVTAFHLWLASCVLYSWMMVAFFLHSLWVLSLCVLSSTWSFVEVLSLVLLPSDLL
jgi:hypothetical protein